MLWAMGSQSPGESQPQSSWSDLRRFSYALLVAGAAAVISLVSFWVLVQVVSS